MAVVIREKRRAEKVDLELGCGYRHISDKNMQ